MKKVVLLAAVLMAFASCKKEEEIEPEVKQYPIKIERALVNEKFYE